MLDNGVVYINSEISVTESNFSIQQLHRIGDSYGNID